MVHAFSQQLAFRIHIKNNICKDTEQDTGSVKVIRMSKKNSSIHPRLEIRSSTLVFKRQKNSAKMRHHFICTGKQKLKVMIRYHVFIQMLTNRVFKTFCTNAGSSQEISI